MEIKTVEAKKAAMVRSTVPLSELSQLMGKAFGTIGTMAQQGKLQIMGPPFALYHNMDMNALDVEVGFPVATDVENHDEVKTGIIPGGRVATAIHKGPYAQMERTYKELQAFVASKGEQADESMMYEYYLNDPAKVSEEDLLTEIYFILKN